MKRVFFGLLFFALLFTIITIFTHNRKLEYVNTSNAGLLGYFNDGTIAGCMKCDFVSANIDSLYKAKVIGSWDKSALPDSFAEDQKDEDLKSGWVMVKGDWLQMPQ